MKIALIIILSLFLLVFLILVYYGIFYKVEVSIKKQGGEIFVYEDMAGDYSQTKKIMDKVYYSLLNDFKTPTTKGCGYYYDNPNHVEKSKLRSEIGCILNSTDSLTIAEISKKFKVRTLENTDYIYTEFPFKGFPSVFISLMKVYPKLARFSIENKYVLDTPVMEIYDIPNKKIIYRKEIK